MGYKSPRQYTVVIVYVNAHYSSQNLYWFQERNPWNTFSKLFFQVLNNVQNQLYHTYKTHDLRDAHKTQ